MLIDLKELRPQNETHDHFFLKQVGRAYLFNQGVRCVATEVGELSGFDRTDFGTAKVVIDVLGIDRRWKENKAARELKGKIWKKALELAASRGVAKPINGGGFSWKGGKDFKSKEDEVYHEAMRKACFDGACESMGYHRLLHENLSTYEKTSQMRGIEVKVSYSDFKNGFSLLPEYAYVLAPKGIVPLAELPAKVGLLEFDFDAYHKTRDWLNALKVAKSPKKQYDSRFMVSEGGKARFDKAAHERFVEEALFKIAQQNTEEHIFWNPHLKTLNDTYVESQWDISFRYKVGDRNSFGFVCDRRFGKTPEKYKNSAHFYARHHYQTEFYRMIEEGKGISKWICLFEIEEASK